MKENCFKISNTHYTMQKMYIQMLQSAIGVWPHLNERMLYNQHSVVVSCSSEPLPLPPRTFAHVMYSYLWIQILHYLTGWWWSSNQNWSHKPLLSYIMFFSRYTHWNNISTLTMSLQTFVANEWYESASWNLFNMYCLTEIEQQINTES